MRRVCVPAALAVLLLPAAAGARPGVLVASPEPLGVLVSSSDTIHVFHVESVGENGVTFKTIDTLKGRPSPAPFSFLKAPKTEA
jgi:hypothetical protein